MTLNFRFLVRSNYLIQSRLSEVTLRITKFLKCKGKKERFQFIFYLIKLSNLGK